MRELVQFAWQKYNVKVMQPIRWFLEFCSFASVYWVLYIYSFSKDSLKYIIIFYTFDALFALNCILVNLEKRFSHGASKQIFLHYIRYHLFLYCLGILPLELIPYLTENYYWMNLFRLNRVLRLIQYHFFMKEVFKSLRIDFSLLIVVSSIANISLFVHICSCVVYFFACPDGICTPESWLVINVDSDENEYISCVFYAISIVTQSGFSTLFPILTKDRLACALIALIGRMLLFITIGQMFMSFRFLKQSYLFFSYKYMHLKKYLQFTTISSSMIKNLCTYFKNLYTHQHGNQIPILIPQLPSYMQCALKSLIYGQYIFNNVVSIMKMILVNIANFNYYCFNRSFKIVIMIFSDK